MCRVLIWQNPNLVRSYTGRTQGCWNSLGSSPCQAGPNTFWQGRQCFTLLLDQKHSRVPHLKGQAPGVSFQGRATPPKSQLTIFSSPKKATPPPAAFATFCGKGNSAITPPNPQYF